jgi:hypothetical protein
MNHLRADGTRIVRSDTADTVPTTYPRTLLLAIIGMREESRNEEAQDEVVATTAVEEEDAAQCTLIKAFIRAK